MRPKPPLRAFCVGAPMPVELNVSADVRQLDRGLSDAARKQIPFAVARALTATADAARISITRRLPQTFDRPNPFTMRAVSIQPARKTSLTARVFVKDAQAKYLAIQETGGTQAPSKAAFVIPKAIGRNAYGNLPRGAIQRAKARKGVFVGKPVEGKQGGIWQHVKGGGLKLLAAFVKKTTYRPRFGFQVQAESVARRVFPAAMREALANAMRTAK